MSNGAVRVRARGSQVNLAEANSVRSGALGAISLAGISLSIQGKVPVVIRKAVHVRVEHKGV